MLFALVDEFQNRLDIAGDVFEIGCHHGKSTVLLGAMVSSTERLGVCDLFSEQTTNVSNSGCGDLDIFRRNMKPLVDNGLRLDVFQQNSQTLLKTEIGQSVRFFHVDGGHNADEALNDLRLASNCLVEGGIIALDDPFRPEWPGVTEAVIRFLDENYDYRAVVVGFNKLILSKKRHADAIRESISCSEMRQSFGLKHPWRLKELPFHTSTLQIFHRPTYMTGRSPIAIATRFYDRQEWLKNKRFDPIVSVAKSIFQNN